MSAATDSATIANGFFPIGIGAADKVVEALTEFRVQNSDDFAHKAAMLCFFAKGYKSYQSIRSLWSLGFSEDAVTVLRSLFELMLQAAWVQGSPLPRARRFLEHERVAQYLHYERLKKSGDDALVTSLEKREEDLSQLKADFDKFKAHYAKGKKGKGFHEHWWKGSIADLAGWLGPDVLKQYYRLYWTMSGYVHSDVHSFAAFLNEDSRGWLINCRPSPPVGLALMTPLFATGWILDISLMMDSTFELGVDEALNGFRREWEKLAETAGGPEP